MRRVVVRHIGVVALAVLVAGGVVVGVPANADAPAGVRVLCDGWEHGHGVVLGTAPTGTEVTVSRGYQFGEQVVSDGIVASTAVGDKDTFEIEIPLRVNKPNYLTLRAAGAAETVELQTLGPVPEYDLGTVYVELAAGADIEEVLARNGVALEMDGEPTYEAVDPGWRYWVTIPDWTEVEVAKRLESDPDVRTTQLGFIAYVDRPPAPPADCWKSARWPVSEVRALTLDALDRGRSGLEWRPLHIASSDPDHWPDLVAALQGALDVTYSRLALYDGGCALATDMLDALSPAFLGTVAATVYGGPAAVDDCFDLDVFSSLSSMRVSGPDRCHTMAAATARWLDALGSLGTDVLLVRDDQPIDAAIALAATRPDAATVRPILLTNPTVLCPAITNLLDTHPTVETVHVIGGPGAISPTVIDTLRSAASRPLDIQRHGGKDRYETAVAVATEMFDEINRPILARGDQPHAALVATKTKGPDTKSPLLLTSDTLPAATADYLKATKPAIRIVGNQQTVSATQRAQIHLLTTN